MTDCKHGTTPSTHLQGKTGLRCPRMGLSLALLPAILIPGSLLQAQQPDCSSGRPFVNFGNNPGQIPMITSRNGRLQGVILLSDEDRNIAGTGFCQSQHMRFFKGWDAANKNPSWPSTGDPIPGPLLRARVGDLIEITFRNEINYKANFPISLDAGGCDQSTGNAIVNNKVQKVPVYPFNDAMPNCLHGSSTANIHFHGTHTTPSTTGDNVLLFIRPALREGGKIEPDQGFINQTFSEFFRWCEKNGPPTRWEQMPPAWQQEQESVFQKLDATLPPNSRLWHKNAEEIRQGVWPQYSIGGFPYCFRLPEYVPPPPGGKAKYAMGQAPGTHWYHAHKHGSTALNVANAMTGVFIIEGAYDDTLRKTYAGLEEQIMDIQQLETSLNVLSSNQNPLVAAPLSINGRLEPVVKMRPGQVQMWRIVNGSYRDIIAFNNFTHQGDSKPCSSTGPCVDWRQIAQDGVQFKWDNYERVGKVDAIFALAPGNRADLLVRAPTSTGKYTLGIGITPAPNQIPIPGTLLTVSVEGDPMNPPMDFIQNMQDFPEFPPFLRDIDEKDIYTRREIVFESHPSAPGRPGPPPGKLTIHTINGKQFSNTQIDQAMLLDSVEEWKLVNKTQIIAHPFHIHINPFQITEVYNPLTMSDPQQLPAPWIWWDTIAIPPASKTLACRKTDSSYACPDSSGSACDPSKHTCTVNNPVPGYIKMRTHFVDFTGQYVLHCHILAHEDRGMMELIEVVPNTTLNEHD